MPNNPYTNTTKHGDQIMLEKIITTKLHMVQLLQSTNIKKIIAADIKTKDDLAKLNRDAEHLLRSNNKITMFLITT